MRGDTVILINEYCLMSEVTKRGHFYEHCHQLLFFFPKNSLNAPFQLCCTSGEMLLQSLPLRSGPGVQPHVGETEKADPLHCGGLNISSVFP